MQTNERDKFKICPKFVKTFGILGRKWNGLIIEVLIKEGPQRFKDLSMKVNKCSDRVLVERLRELEDEKIIERVPLKTCHNIYQLTPKGKDMQKIMKAVHQWSDKWCMLNDRKKDA